MRGGGSESDREGEGRYARGPVVDEGAIDGRPGAGRAGSRGMELAPAGWGFSGEAGGHGRVGGVVGGAGEGPQRIVPVRISYARPAGPCRSSSPSTCSVCGTVHERAAARPGTDVVPSDLRAAIACCRSSGAGRDQNGSRTERGGPARSRKSIVREESRGNLGAKSGRRRKGSRSLGRCHQETLFAGTRGRATYAARDYIVTGPSGG